jgi:iron(III) transport system substrate-binding protein
MGLLIAVLLTSTACFGGDDEETLVVYSGRSESLVGALIQQFEDASGVKVSVKYGSTSEIAATLQEEGKDSPADIFFAQDQGGLGAVAAMLSPLPQDLVEAVPDWARSPEGKWVGISGRARTVVYNTDNLTEADLPGSIEGFTDPAWKGRIGWAPSNGSFQTMVTAMRVMWGEDRTRLWLEGIKANEPRVYPNNTSIVMAAEAAEVNVGFVNHYYLHRFIQEEGEDFSARNYFTKEGGPGSLVIVAGAGILETADDRENAEKFVRFLLSVVAQRYFASQTFEYPLIDGVNISRLLEPLEETNSPAVDPADLDDLKGTQKLLRDVGIIP